MLTCVGLKVSSYNERNIYRKYVSNTDFFTEKYGKNEEKLIQNLNNNLQCLDLLLKYD